MTCPTGSTCQGSFVWAETDYFVLFANTSAVTSPNNPLDGQNQFKVEIAKCPTGFCQAVQCKDANCPLLSSPPVRCVVAHNDTELESVPFYCQGFNNCTNNRVGFMCSDCEEGFGHWNGNCIGTHSVCIMCWCCNGAVMVL